MGEVVLHPHELALVAVILACLLYIIWDMRRWYMYVSFIGFCFLFSSPFIGKKIAKPENYSSFSGWCASLSLVGCLFFIARDIQRRYIYIYFMGLFYFFSTQFYRKKIAKPSYSNLSGWYVAWIFLAALHHFPSIQLAGLDLRMSLAQFLTFFIYSVLVLTVFHIICTGLRYVGLVSRKEDKHPNIVITIAQNCAVISAACCLFYSQCVNDATLGENIEDEYQSYQSISYVVSSYKWFIHGEKVSSGSSACEIFHVFSFWEVLVLLHIVSYCLKMLIRDRQQEPIPEDEKPGPEDEKPDFEDMVPWYSGTSTDIFKTALDLMISLTLFVGRFDMRMMQVAMSKVPDHEGKKDDFFYDHFCGRDGLWFDFVADIGDGGNSTYTVAKVMAQRSIEVEINGSMRELPRGDLLLIGGDLAYPNPSSTTYERRFIRPYEYALQPLEDYSAEHDIAVNKELPDGYEGPQCFIIPGNHDWFDGLQTFMRYICHKCWLGGWFLPQKKSYFALQLPKGWWIFGLDQSLHDDIDVHQFDFFKEICQQKVGESDSVILMTHEPTWLNDWYWKKKSGRNVSHLVERLSGRCRLRMAGDLHHYMRHSLRDPPKGSAHVQHLLVNGCGGAFLHPTHCFSNFNQFDGNSYDYKACYPSCPDSKKIALGNINFRRKNWRFDVIGGVLYFILVFSAFPQCGVSQIVRDGTWSGILQGFFSAMWSAFMHILEYSSVSLAGCLVFTVAASFFAPKELPLRRRAALGALHAFAHVTAALVLSLLLELIVEIFIHNNLLSTSDYHALYESSRPFERRHFPDPNGLRAHVEQWSFGLYPACIKYLMSAFDVPQIMAVTRNKICEKGMESLPRSGAIIYYASMFLYFWFLSTPVVSLIFGSYLYICIRWFHIHFDEAFSSLRVADYKAFTRFHIRENGNLEVFTLAVDKVPKDWKVDPKWKAQKSQPLQQSYLRSYPSKWMAASGEDPINSVKVVDHFVIKCTPKTQI